MAIYIMQQIVDPASPWQLYLQLLPRDHSAFPINYSNQELT